MSNFAVAGIPLEYPIVLEGGPGKTPEAFGPFTDPNLPLGALNHGSTTPKKREPNEGTVIFPDDIGTLLEIEYGANAFGMNNKGNETSSRELDERYANIARPIFANIAGFSIEDYLQGIEIFDGAESCVAAILLNLSCPNNKEHRLPIALDLDFLRQLLEAIGERGVRRPVILKTAPGTTVPVVARLSQRYPRLDFTHTPLVEPDFFYRFGELLRPYRFVRAVDHSNTIGNVIIRDVNGQPATTPNSGQAGLSGTPLKEVVYQDIPILDAALPEGIDLIATGGVLHGDDVVDYLELCQRVKAVGIASVAFWGGPKAIVDLLESKRLQSYLAERMPESESQPHH